jgi:hypothetical protein
VLSGRVSLLTSGTEFFVSPVMCEGDGGRRLCFDARFEGHFVFGTAELRNVFVSGAGEPASTHVRIMARAGSGVSAYERRFGDISVHTVVTTAKINRGARQEPSALLVRMHEQGVPVHELDRTTIGYLEQALENTLPEHYLVGHLVTRIHTAMRYAMWAEGRTDPQKALAWCHETSCLALEMPDDHFRHFVAGALQAKIALLMSTDQALSSDASVSALDRYVRLLRRLPERSQLEVRVVCLWFLATFQDDYDLASIDPVSRTSWGWDVPTQRDWRATAFGRLRSRVCSLCATSFSFCQTCPLACAGNSTSSGELLVSLNASLFSCQRTTNGVTTEIGAPFWNCSMCRLTECKRMEASGSGTQQARRVACCHGRRSGTAHSHEL